MPEPIYQYTPVAHELADALRHVLNAQDFAMGAGEAETMGPTDRDRLERGNVVVALSRLQNAIRALGDRRAAVMARVAAQEAQAMVDAEPELQKIRARVDDDVAALTPPQDLAKADAVIAALAVPHA